MGSILLLIKDEGYYGEAIGRLVNYQAVLVKGGGRLLFLWKIDLAELYKDFL